jgi:Ras-related protein Rab-7A
MLDYIITSFIGDPCVGKTCAIRRFTDNQYSDGYKATIGIDFVYRKFRILGQELTLHMLDH